MNLDEIDPNFVADLRKSDEATEVVARWIRWTMGYAVTVNPIFIRDDPGRADDFADGGDMLISRVVEVKRREIDFNSASSFPFEDVIVDKVSTFDAKPSSPWKYFIVNRAMTGAFVVDVNKTLLFWKKRDVWSEKRGRTCAYYHCPLELVEYRSLEVAL